MQAKGKEEGYIRLRIRIRTKERSSQLRKKRREDFSASHGTLLEERIRLVGLVLLNAVSGRRNEKKEEAQRRSGRERVGRPFLRLTFFLSDASFLGKKYYREKYFAKVE